MTLHTVQYVFVECSVRVLASSTWCDVRCNEQVRLARCNDIIIEPLTGRCGSAQCVCIPVRYLYKLWCGQNMLCDVHIFILCVCKIMLSIAALLVTVPCALSSVCCYMYQPLITTHAKNK